MTNAENTLKNLKNYLAAVIRSNPDGETDDRQAGRIDTAEGALIAIQILEGGVVSDLGFREAPEPVTPAPEEPTYTVEVNGRYWYIAEPSEVGQVSMGDTVDVQGQHQGAHWQGVVTAWMSADDYVRTENEDLPRLKVLEIVPDEGLRPSR